MEILSGGRRRLLVWLLAVVGMILGLVFTVPAIDAEGTHDQPLSPGGLILLSTGPNLGTNGDYWVKYYADPTNFNINSPTETQQFVVSSKCDVTQVSGPEILKITPSATQGNSRLSAVSNGIGVGNKKNCSTSEGRISDGQKLTFALGSYFGSSSEFIEQVEIDIEAKFGTDLAYTIDGGGLKIEDLMKAQDNGPDAGAADNEIAVIDQADAGKLFKSISFFPSVAGAEISIEGGGDGTVSGGPLRGHFGVNKTLFKLREGLDCGDMSTGTAAAHPNGPAESITLWRGENKDKSTCIALTFDFVIQDDVVLFSANFGAQPTADFLIKIVWKDGVDPTEPPIRRIDTTDDGVDNFEDVQACTALTDEGSTMDPRPDIDDVYTHPGVGSERVPWCLAGEEWALTLDTEEVPSYWRQVQWYDGAGDPQFR